MRHAEYIGEFPPPYGGVTVKNSLIVSIMEKYYKVRVADLVNCRRNVCSIPSLAWKILCSFRSGNIICYGIGKYSRLYVLLILQRILAGKKRLSRTHIFVMGGIFQEYVADRRILRKLLSETGRLYVETEGMKVQMEKMGLQNIVVFPNPKPEAGDWEPRENREAPLKLVFFSKICEEKGVKDVMELVKRLEEKGNIPYQLDFYGHIDSKIESEFRDFVGRENHAAYRGVFDTAKSDVYCVLNRYDILLFPTRWKAEGVPGILIESKMAGIAVIASAGSYNAEIIREEGGEGVLLRNDYPQEMLNGIERFHLDRGLLFRVKTASFQSRSRYALNEYEKMIADMD